MAKQRQRKVLPAPTATLEEDDAMLMKSAESLARVIEALQRQLREAWPGLGARRKPKSASPRSSRANGPSKSEAPTRRARTEKTVPPRRNPAASGLKRRAKARTGKKR